MTTPSPGRTAYERYLARHPNGPLGERNPTWEALPEAVRERWDRNAAVVTAIKERSHAIADGKD